MPRETAQRSTSTSCSFCASVGVSLLYMPQVTFSPMPLKRSQSSPKPIGSICVSSLKSSSSWPRRGADRL